MNCRALSTRLENMEYIIETKNLTKKFPKKLAVDSINMHIKKGDIYGFVGKNGAGKTTAMKLILGLLNPTCGEILLFGSNKLDNERRRIGSLIEAPGLYKNSSAFENLKRFSILYGGTNDEINDILKLVGLNTNRKVGNFSLGMKQRLGIAISLLGNPELLVLDEPINGLDPEGIKEIRDVLLRLNKEKGVTILISSHIIDELAKITTRYGIINDGKLVEEIEANELLDRCKDKLLIKVSDTDKALNILNDNNLLEKYDVKDKVIHLYSNCEHPEKINELLVKNSIMVYELTYENASFEDYFIERIGR